MANKVTLNKKDHEVDPKFIESLNARLSGRLSKIRADRVQVDTLSITGELGRMYGAGLQQKSWYKDFVMQFCMDRRIPCDIRNL